MALLKLEPFQIDTIANFVFANVSVTSNLSSGNANLGNLAIANYFTGNGSLLTSITGANVSGQVANSLVTGTVYTNAQPNITSVGTLTSLSVNGNLSVGVANLKISGGTANYVLKTDGTGNVSWAAPSGGTQSFVKEYVWKGGLTENVGSLRHYIHTTSTLVGIYAYLVSAGLTQSTVVVKKNGTSINTITIPANSTNVNQSGLSISLAAADYLTVDITQSSSASDLYINFVYQG